MLGGYGSCGRPLCCTTLLQTFEPVSIKMAKQQDLSLNPSKLSGLCGRLKCCLRYELPNGEGRDARRLRQRGRLRQPDGLRRRRLRRRLRAATDLMRCKPRDRDHRRRSGRHRARDRAKAAARSARARRRASRCIYGPPTGTFAPGVLSRRPAARPTTRSCGRSATRSAGALDAIATAPVNKEAFALAGLPWKGPHRSARAPDRRAARGDDVLLGAAARRARHGSRAAGRRAGAADAGRCWRSRSMLTARELPRFGIAQPRIAVAGLNPHAGEHGRHRARRRRGARAGGRPRRGPRRRRRPGPLPGDTVFVARRPRRVRRRRRLLPRSGTDSREAARVRPAVNVTLGLPIVRTSVDHGTAFDIAGRGMADPSSLVEAVLLAARLAS